MIFILLYAILATGTEPDALLWTVVVFCLKVWIEFRVMVRASSSQTKVNISLIFSIPCGGKMMEFCRDFSVLSGLAR